MRHFAQSSLALLGLALVAPSGGRAQDVAATAPAGYMSSVGLDGRPVPAPEAPVAPHSHKGRVLCASCAKKQKQAGMTPPGRIVACAHSKNGVCTACQAALAMPGEFTMSTPAGSSPMPASGDAAGRAVASSSPSPSASASHMANQKGAPGMVAPAYGQADEPSPIGVVQANFAPGGGSPMPASAMMDPSAQPGRAVAFSGAGSSPYEPKSGPFPHPHVLRHLLGFEGWFGGEGSDARRKKAEAHAMINYNNEGTTINDLPASSVYGRR